MANADLKTFIEDRLRVLVPGIDLEAGSPAQIQFIEPVMTRLGSDPFETDIDTFITDRFTQEFPDIFSGDPSAVRDLLIKPAIVFFEPFKREIAALKRNQSLQDPSVLSDEDADALVANIFDERDSGHYATGVVRIFYPNPSTQQIDTSTTFSSSGGLTFFPSSPIGISAEEMVFNRQGSLYYMDVPVRAEVAGAEYNIDANTITSVSGVFGAVKVTNPRPFVNGTTKVDTTTFVAQARESLTERSLVSRRGANARLRQVFQGQVLALQVIGAGDAEMQRDILVGTSPGHAWASGKVTLYENVALVQCRTIEASEPSVPVAGDSLYLYLDQFSYGGRWQGLQTNRFVRLRVEELIGPAMGAGAVGPPGSNDGFQASFFLRWSDPDGALPTSAAPPISVNGGLIRKGTLKVSSLPSVGKVDVEVPNQEVHIYGHTDIYVRPVVQDVSNAVLASIQDEQGIVQRTTLRSILNENYLTDATTNSVTGAWTSAYDFALNGVAPGDLLTIENGDDAGTYIVLKVTPTVYSGATITSPSRVYVATAFSRTATDLRYRLTRSVTFNPFEPKVQKLPFGTNQANDLQTSIGSNLLILVGTNAIDYSVKPGDTVRIKEGLDAGDYTVTGFDSVLGGRGIVVDRFLGSSNANLSYEIFTALEQISKPLVRIRDMLLLDSAKKSTGISVPPADPVAVCPTSDFTTARVRTWSETPSGFVLPAMRDYLDANSVAAAAAQGNDRRYSLGIEDVEGGVYKAMRFDDNAQNELLFPEDCLDSCSYFLSIPEDFGKAENFPPIDPRPGDALHIKNGPNEGSYIVKKVRKFNYHKGGKKNWMYLVQIYGSFPVDVFEQLVDFLDQNGYPVAKLTGNSSFAFPSFFTDIYDHLGEGLVVALSTLGAATPEAAQLQEAASNLLQVRYEIGDPARGVLRSYFTRPTLFQQHTADSPVATVYDFKTPTGETVSYRPDPFLYAKHEVIPPRGTGDTDPKEYPRDLSLAGSVATFSTDARPTVFSLGVLVGDVLSVHEELFFHGTTAAQCTAVQTFQGQPRVLFPNATLTSDFVGNLLAIEEGDDKGVYRITDVLSDGRTALLDQPLLASTQTLLTNGEGTWFSAAGVSKVTSSALFTSDMVNKWLSMFGVPATDDVYWQGSFRITEVVDSSTVIVDTTSTAVFPTSAGVCQFVVTAAPTVAPVPIDGNTAGRGTVLTGVRPVRVYNDVVSNYSITDIETNAAISAVTVTGTPKLGYKQPFRIYRENLRRVNPMEMTENRDGALYYFDTEVVSLSPMPAANITRQSYLVPRDGTYESWGYKHVVDDSTLTYSVNESGRVTMPTRILPSFSTDSADNFILIVGAPLQVSYERGDVIAQVQEFVNSAEDRVTTANMLVRHFLPSYVSFDATYVGGSAPSVIAKDVIEYINSLPIETVLDVSVVQDFIARRGGNINTPTKVVSILHDWDRRMWMEFSENELGGLSTKVPYNGSPRVAYFVPGTDTSGQTDIPDGDRINLVQL